MFLFCKVQSRKFLIFDFAKRPFHFISEGQGSFLDQTTTLNMANQKKKELNLKMFYGVAPIEYIAITNCDAFFLNNISNQDNFFLREQHLKYISFH